MFCGSIIIGDDIIALDSEEEGKLWILKNG
jgi:hypothetical protein